MSDDLSPTPDRTSLPVPLKASAKRKVAELNKASGELEKLDFNEPGQILKLAGQMDLMGSSVLAGFLGGAVGSTAGVTLGGIAIAGFALPTVAITGPLGMAVGVAVAILAWRGRRRWYLEKEISNNRIVLSEIDERIDKSLMQIKALPSRTPDSIRKQMWDFHENLVRQRHWIERDAMRKLVDGVVDHDDFSK